MFHKVSAAHFLPSVRCIDVTYQTYFGSEWRKKTTKKKNCEKHFKKVRLMCLLEGVDV